MGLDKLMDSIAETVVVRNLLTKLTDKCFENGQTDMLFIAQERGFELSDLQDSGLFLFTDDMLFTLIYNSIVGAEYRDKLALIDSKGEFQHKCRTVFPVRDQMNNVMAWVSWQKHKQHKYLTSKTFGFEKSACFYGMEYFDEILKKGYAIIVEGMFDVVRWRSLGYYNVLGTMGNDLTLHKRMILNRIPVTIFCPDNDKGGRENSHKNKQSGFSDYRLWATDKKFVRVELKGGYKDYDDYFKVETNREMAKIIIDTALQLKSGEVLSFETV